MIKNRDRPRIPGGRAAAVPKAVAAVTEAVTKAEARAVQKEETDMFIRQVEEEERKARQSRSADSPSARAPRSSSRRAAGLVSAVANARVEAGCLKRGGRGGPRSLSR